MKTIYKIEGGNVLTGTIPISGSKNAALPIICGAVVLKRKVILHNIPDISDVRDLLKILEYLNVFIEFKNGTLIIDASKIINKKVPYSFTSKFRASYYLLGSLINIFDSVEIGKAGGCKIGVRPIDQHILGFEKLGYLFLETEKSYLLSKKKVHGSHICFQKNSLGASINVVLSSLLIGEEVYFSNISTEPEFIDFIEFLKVCGFSIYFDIENKTLILEPSLLKKNISYQVMFDRIEAGTYAILGAILGHELLIKNFDRYYLSFLLKTFQEMGVKYSLVGNDLLISKTDKIKYTDIEVDTFPSFATDLQQIISILMLKAEGLSSIKDNLFPSRFNQLEEIGHQKINYQITDRILIVGENQFHSGYYTGNDLRGSMALLIYCLGANGVSYLSAPFLERGYDNFYEKLRAVGACIVKESIND